MASASDLQEEEEEKSKPTHAPPSPPHPFLDGPYDEILKRILDKKPSFGVIETVIDFLGRKSDLFDDENVDSKALGMVSAARKGFEERKRKPEERGLKESNKRLKEAAVVVEKKDETVKNAEKEVKEESHGDETEEAEGKSDEPGWRDIRSGSEYGISEESRQTASSTASLGSPSQEPKAIKKCDLCSFMHDLADCPFKKKAIVPSKKVCEICHDEEHNTFQCSQFLAYYAADNYSFDDEYEAKSLELSKSDDEEGPEADSKIVCEVCYGDHINTCCKYYHSVPQNAKIGPFYQIFCGRCHFEIENDLNCPQCRRVVPGYVGSRVCDSCGELMPTGCCAWAKKKMADGC